MNVQDGLRRVVDCVKEKDVVSFLRDLIKTPSQSGEEQEISELIAKKMESCGLSVEVVGGNVVGELISAKEGPTLVLNGHMDTVPAGDLSTWTVDPFSAEIREGRIYGRGASDMKGGLASMIMAVDALKGVKKDLRGNLIVTAVILEEVGEKLSERKGVVELIDKGIIRGDAAIVGEPTCLNVSIGHRSRALFELVTYGKAAHASTPEMGVNAIEKMTKIIQALKSLRTGHNEILGRGTFNIGVIKGGTRANVVPDHCKIMIDRRLTLGETPENSLKDIKEIVEKAMNEDRCLKAEAKRVYGWLPTLTSKKEAVIKVLSKSVEAVTEKKPRIIVSRFHTDGGFIHHMTGLPVAIFGPGREELTHIADEYVEINHVVEATKIYAATINNFLHLCSYNQ